jgi:hypothetical protein
MDNHLKFTVLKMYTSVEDDFTSGVKLSFFGQRFITNLPRHTQNQTSCLRYDECQVWGSADG